MRAVLPPVARVAVAFAAGVAAARTGTAWPALSLTLLASAPIGPWRRPLGVRAAWGLAILGGALATFAAGAGCPPEPHPGTRAAVMGRILAAADGPAPFRVAGGRCGRKVIRAQGAKVPPGALVTLHGVWRARGRGVVLLVDSVAAAPGSGTRRAPDVVGALIRRRSALVERLRELYPERWGVVAALVLARKEGLDPRLRDAFARTGTAHLLAISGFHVGVLAGLLLGLLRLFGVRRGRAAPLAAALTWLYVGFIGAPAAASRAAWIVTAVALSRMRGRPPARLGPLGLALLVLLVGEPTALFGAGFQLSFAGAASLTLWAAPLSRRIREGGGRLTQALADRVAPGRRAEIPSALADTLAAGVAATCGTLPIVAWHFERISVVGVPATLLATPLVVPALPGALASLALDAVHPVLGRFAAGGVDVLLLALTGLVDRAAALPWASVWVARSWVPWLTAGLLTGLLWARGPGIGGRARRVLMAACVLLAFVGRPLVDRIAGSGRLELFMMDVGQGDAIALRTPGGRWVLVDAGPPGPGQDPGANAVVRALRRRGVRALDLVVFTHPDLDHIGGGVAVLRALPVRAAMDPGLVVGKGPYVALLEEAVGAGVPWLRARQGVILREVRGEDTLTLRVLHPGEARSGEGGEERGRTPSANDVSVVLQATYGAFDVLLTGDAPAPVERTLAPAFAGEVEVLKVGHHGSDTSTDPSFLAAVAPELALISAGRGNRFGHPTAGVLARLRDAGVAVLRTDRDGSIRVFGYPDGSFRTDPAGGPGEGRIGAR